MKKRDRKEYRREYYLRNRELEIERTKEWRRNNLEHAKKYRKEHYENNREKYNEDKRRWRRERPDLNRAMYERKKEKYSKLGLCMNCGKPKDIMGFVTSEIYCAVCRMNNNEITRMWKYINST